MILRDIYNKEIDRDIIRHDNNIFYVKWERTGYGAYSNDQALVIYELDIESGRKKILIDFYPHCSVTKLECDGENLYYYTKSSYGDRNEDKKKIKLKSQETKDI